MAFATNTLVNGEWTTRTVDVDAVLRHYNEQDEGASSSGVEVQKPPVLGVLAQTAIRSPLVNLIIPCKLRGSKTNDIAFIGVSGPSLLCIESARIKFHPYHSSAISNCHSCSSYFPSLAFSESLYRDKPAIL